MPSIMHMFVVCMDKWLQVIEVWEWMNNFIPLFSHAVIEINPR